MKNFEEQLQALLGDETMHRGNGLGLAAKINQFKKRIVKRKKRKMAKKARKGKRK